MKPRKKRKCRNCKTYFRPDPRVGERQKFCSEPACKSASKTQSQRRWLDKPGNRNYFSGPAHVERVRRWRQTHPGYWKKSGTDRDPALQDESRTQAIDLSKQSGTLTSDALQDLIFAQPFVFVGLLANLTYRVRIQLLHSKLLILIEIILGAYAIPSHFSRS